MKMTSLSSVQMNDAVINEWFSKVLQAIRQECAGTIARCQEKLALYVVRHRLNSSETALLLREGDGLDG